MTRQKIQGFRQKNEIGNSEGKSKDSPEIADMRGTLDIPASFRGC